MNLKIKITSFITCITCLCILWSCGHKKPAPLNDRKKVYTPGLEKDYLNKIMGLDTLPSGKVRMDAYLKEEQRLKSDPNFNQNPFYHYIRARLYRMENKADSALIEFGNMKVDQKWNVVDLIKTCSILDQAIDNGVMVEAKLMNQIVAATQAAEGNKSKIVYKYYDLLAKAYYQNQHNKQALYYTNQYYQHHPFKTNRVIQQRYYDICFLLASRLMDDKKMAEYNSKARLYAENIGDSMALARTYDNESQIYAMKRNYRKSLSSSKMYFNYLVKMNMLHDVAYNNLANSYINMRMPDSAIFYFRKGIEMAKNNNPTKIKDYLYKGLIDAYAMKGEYKKALDISVAAHEIEINNLKAIDVVKIEELHEKYDAEKKDQNIATLKHKNRLSESVIRQQKWMIFSALVVCLGAVALVYSIYRQRNLHQKNQLLASENQRLSIEQKLLQAQLNPHFIFNSIANLQSLIAMGNASESVRYLSFFSRLLRDVLEQSRKDFISLDEEITSLQNYVQLQQMRYPGLFKYEITISEDLNSDTALIPPMLLQPFVENAIEHGFRNLQYEGLLKIDFSLKNGQLLILINDNGSGITNKTVSQSGKTSLAQVILKERLKVLFKVDCQHAFFEVRDRKVNNEKGVEVQLFIPMVYD